MLAKLARHSSFFTIALLVLLSFFPLITAYRYPIFLNDDAYITLTYVKNIVDGNGFVFNHPPAVLGTTTPLLVIVLSVLAKILDSNNIPVMVVFFSASCWIGVIWIFYFFRNEWGLTRWQVSIFALILTGMGWVRILEMEVYLFAFLLLLGLSLLLKKQYWISGLIIGLLFLTRGEGVLVLGVVFVTIFIEHWLAIKSINVNLLKKWIYTGLGFSIPVILWAIFANFTFGSFLPNTLAGKIAQGQSGLWTSFMQRLVTQWAPTWGQPFTIKSLPFINFWWIICLLGLAYVALWKRKWLMLISWIAFYTIGYSVLKVPGYVWYQYPILFVMSQLFALGIIMIIEAIMRYVSNKGAAWAISVVITLLLVFVASRPTVQSVLTFQGDSRGESYIALSQWFRDNTQPSESISYIEIGYLGYYTSNRIIDLAGLLLPDANRYIANRDFSWSFWNYKPDYYIYLPDFDWALGSIRSDPRFDQQYHPLTTLSGPWTTNFVIYKRTSK